MTKIRLGHPWNIIKYNTLKRHFGWFDNHPFSPCWGNWLTLELINFALVIHQRAVITTLGDRNDALHNIVCKEVEWIAEAI